MRATDVAMFARRAMSASTVLLIASGAAAAQSAPTDSTRLSITPYGEVRTRSEWDRPMSNTPSDFFTLMRSRLGLRIVPSSSAVIVLEAQDSRVLGDASATARQSFDLHQGFLELTTRVGSPKLVVRAGRQEIALANQRLVGAVDWSNFGRAFDGVRFMLSSPTSESSPISRWSAEAFAATLEERGRHFGVNRTTRQQDRTLGGVFLSRSLNSARSAQAELTSLLDVGSDYRAYHDARRATTDLRIRHANISGVRFELEGAIQSGNQRVVIDSIATSQSVSAWLLGVRIGNVTNVKSRNGLTAGVDMLSGDATPNDNKYTSFSTLYGTNHGLYGLMDIVGDPAAETHERGLQDFFLHGDVRMNDRVRVHTELHQMRLASGSGRDFGFEADAVIPVQLTPQARLDIGYTAFRAGRDAQAVGFAREGAIQQWAFLQLRAAFQR